MVQGDGCRLINKPKVRSITEFYSLAFLPAAQRLGLVKLFVVLVVGETFFKVKIIVLVVGETFFCFLVASQPIFVGKTIF